MAESLKIEISVVIPVKNGELWISQALESVLNQDFEPKNALEVSIYDDQSTDRTLEVAGQFESRFSDKGVNFVLRSGKLKNSGGVGYAKNQAVIQSRGRFLCFLDADDEMVPDRLSSQYQAAISLSLETLIGSKFHRDPPGATERYSKWANSISQEQLYHQRFTTHGPTLIAPTWFCSRELYNTAGGFKEIPKGFPEDLDLFFRILKVGGKLYRVEKDLVKYRYHPGCESFSVRREAIENIRSKEFQDAILPIWPRFSIWNAGKEGRRFFKSLSPENRQRVGSFIDIDPKKLELGSYQIFDDSARKYIGPRIPIVKPCDARPPAVICVKLDMTNGDLERIIESLFWKEGTDFFYFN